ncbi:MAG: ribosome-recycling factor [bacterium]
MEIKNFKLNEKMDLSSFKSNLSLTISALKEELKSIRTGRANPAMIEDIVIEAYGGTTKLRLKELATITTDGASALLIAPFDPSTIIDIEKGILKSPLGITPQTQGTRITIRIPPMSQEQRDKYVKLVGQMIEEKRSIVRNHRDDIRKKIRDEFEKKTITEDDKYRLEKEIDTLTQKTNEDIASVKAAKDTEIQQV